MIQEGIEKVKISGKLALLVIFSPVFPAAITMVLVLGGLLASGGFRVTASFVFYWMYRYATGKHPIGEDSLDRAREKIIGATMELRHKAEQLGQQTVGAGHHQSS